MVRPTRGLTLAKAINSTPRCERENARAGAAVNCGELAQKTGTIAGQLMYSTIDVADHFSGVRGEIVGSTALLLSLTDSMAADRTVFTFSLAFDNEFNVQSRQAPRDKTNHSVLSIQLILNF
jgi:hypothetical protein